jgi:hypothetical protein
MRGVLIGLFFVFAVVSVAAQVSWNVVLGFGDREPIPLMGLEDRVNQFVIVSDPNMVEALPAFGGDDSGGAKLHFTLSNASAYPITEVEVQCDMNWRDLGSNWENKTVLDDGEVLMPNESRSFVLDTRQHSTYQDALDNIACRVEETNHPFETWDGMPQEFSYLDWQRGAAAFLER